MLVHVVYHDFLGPIVIEVASSDTPRASRFRDRRACLVRHIEEITASSVPKHLALLLITAAGSERVNLGIYMSVRNENVFPAVIVEIEEAHSPTQKSRAPTQPRLVGNVAKCSVTVIVVKIRDIALEIRLYNIEEAILVIVSRSSSHTGLLLPVIVEAGSRHYAHVRECTVSFVVVENARGGIACNVDVRPAVVVEIGYYGAERVAASDFCDAGLFRDVSESAISVIVVKSVGSGRQASRAAHYRQALPHAILVAAFWGSRRQVKVDVAGHEQVEFAVAIIVDKTAASAPARRFLGEPRIFSDV